MELAQRQSRRTLIESRQLRQTDLAESRANGIAVVAFARALGEYGSVVFISGNMPMRTEIAPLVIMTKLEQYDYAGATAIAVTLLVASFLLLGAVNLLQAWSARRGGVE